ncbi:dynamin family protein [Paenibacillus sp. GCM10027626]|uniref:dynamin family protein n=1 Tax=Paenibacillus sp. GCM10027626 TaxID=3273411 RepID=UPI0036386C14
MSKSVVETLVHPLDGALEKLAAQMKQAGDGDNAGRLGELREKLAAGRLTVAFCGHFSAGKSTLVNRLCGEKLLPSSPIPTSANVVSIANGEPRAVIARQKSGKMESQEVPLDRLDEYCADGESVRFVTITYPIPRLGNHTVLLDTPGIDSTDDAHRAATESALHMADVVFYVMDYNHVQSEINFTFAKQLKDWGKPLYLIVNQIDKHREGELSLEQYRASVEEGFANWHLEPAGIIYLSLRQPHHPGSEWGKLERLLTELAVRRKPLSICSVYDSARFLVERHLKWQEEQAADEREQLIAAAGGEEELQRLRTAIADLEAQLASYSSQGEQLQEELLRETRKLLDNANIIPATTRELAHSFLESRKPGFKAGLFFAGAKTLAEQERRLALFGDDFAAQAAAGIEWHLNDLLRKAAAAVGWKDDSLEAELKATIHWEAQDDWFLSHVKAGAVFGNEYTMNYCRELSADLKELYRKRSLSWIEQLAQRAAAAAQTAAAPAQAELNALRAQAGASERLAALDQRMIAYKAQFELLMPPSVPRPELPKPVSPKKESSSAAETTQATQVTQASEVSIQDGQAAAVPITLAVAEGTQRHTPPSGQRDAFAKGDALAPQREAAARLQRAASLLSGYEALDLTVQAMREKAERLQASRFTIALFGAFSAGKSSLANALLGEGVLPVSPNPTTAAVNRIVPPTEEHPHHSAVVVMKSRETMIDDLKYSLKLLGEEADSLNEQQLLQAIGKLSPDGIHAGGRPHYSFLKAAAQGWADHHAQLGQRLTTDGEEYRRFVAEESRSCFVSEIELHHKNALTDQGIVLVDTPGADSVNARHTGVAFNYIKNADAILFVTYYNHAFSQADRQFLLQLGRVKDQFELDKMFFIVNAADLAEDEEELQGVLAHVERNLQQHGIRFPRMFPVSSLAALEGKLAGDQTLRERSGIDGFESAFMSFTQGDLGQMAVSAAQQELERVRGTISGWLAAASGDAATREAERERLLKYADDASKLLDKMTSASANAQLEQELKELLHYVLQRVQYRFGDHYNFAFNPSVLQDDGRDMRKALWTAWLELQRLLQIELSQELEATSLRLDNALLKLAAQKYAEQLQEVAELLPGFTAAPFSRSGLEAPESFAAWQAERIDAKWLWSRFKSPRHFFEGEGKAALRSALEAELLEPLQRWLANAEQQWQQRYAQLWQATVDESSAQLRSDIAVFVEGRVRSLSGDADVVELQRLSAALAEI